MSLQANPFTPTFGVVPPVLAGRERFMRVMRDAFENGPGDPNLSTLLIGARGTGKTALLSSISSQAGAQGWVSADVICAPGMLEDIVQRTYEAASHLIDTSPRRHLTGLTLGQLVGLEWADDDRPLANWRTRMNALLSELDEHGTGLVITVDEVDAGVSEMIHLAGVYQLFVRERRKVALVMAGLPMNVMNLLTNKNVSFLRRSQQHHLGRIPDAEVAFAFRRTIEEAGKAISDSALDAAVDATEGFAYMMQLVGYWSWQECGTKDRLDDSDITKGAELARKSLRSGVLDTTYRELSAGDRRFLYAMLDDPGESRLTDIAARMGKATNYASTYKARLLGQGIIEELPGKTLKFELPAFREYLEEKRGEK